MTRLYARALKGKRAHGARPDKRGKNITIIGAIATRGIVGAMSFKGGNDKNAFKTYINQVLVSSAKESIRRMKPPRCTPYPPAARYKRVVVRSLWYDADGLTVEVQGPGFVFARVVFRRPVGFRVLDERDPVRILGQLPRRQRVVVRGSRRRLAGVGVAPPVL
ncbi:hypothetical protein NSTCB13_00713 [Nostoc sp. DSM 114160]|jgi:hypothetical protein